MGIQLAPTYDPTAAAPPSPLVAALTEGLLGGHPAAIALCEDGIAGMRAQPFALAGVIKGLFELAFVLDTTHARADLADEVLALVHRSLGLLAENVATPDGKMAAAAVAPKATKTVDLPRPRSSKGSLEAGVGLRRAKSKSNKGSP